MSFLILMRSQRLSKRHGEKKKPDQEKTDHYPGSGISYSYINWLKDENADNPEDHDRGQQSPAKTG
jgi:hypothetical protein